MTSALTDGPSGGLSSPSLNDQVLGSLGSLEPGSLGASQLLQLMRLTRIFFYLPTTPHVVSASRGPQGLHLAIMG